MRCGGWTNIDPAGGDDNDLYFLLAGRYEIGVNGRIIAIRGPGEHVGEMAAILPSLRRSATVQSSESGAVAKLNSIGLIEFANHSKAFCSAGWCAIQS
jgi:CRP-like cAMP-binding protein